MSQSEYVLRTGEDELKRLGLQHRLWSDAAHAAWRLAGVAPGMRVLDVGCGPGFAAFDLAQIVGTSPDPSVAVGRVVGVDESEPFLSHLREQAAARGFEGVVEGHRGNATDLGSLVGRVAELRGSSFDVAYARWVLCFVSDPLAVLRGVHGLLKPGGRFVIQDYFNYESMATAPRSAAFAKAVAATGKSWRSRGGDPDIVGRLPGLLIEAGFRVEHLNVHQRIARPGSSMWHWPQSFWTNFLPVLVEMGLLTEGDRAAWHEEWRRLSATPGAFVLLPPVFDVIGVKA